MPSTRQGCAEILGDEYHGKIPLPRIPMYQGYGITARHIPAVMIGNRSVTADLNPIYEAQTLLRGNMR